MAQIASVTSEALQSTIRRLLPSQQGFGEDLQAQNVIVPVIDLTATAEGSALPVDLQRALALNSNTEINKTGATTTTIANVGGFYRIIGGSSYLMNNSNARKITFSITDGITTKIVNGVGYGVTAGNTGVTSNTFDFVIYLNSGESCILSTEVNTTFIGSIRQIADLSGNIVNPSGFSSQ
jgi:hypothetical protein